MKGPRVTVKGQAAIDAARKGAPFFVHNAQHGWVRVSQAELDAALARAARLVDIRPDVYGADALPKEHS